jgi:shikimate kinase / 3-dehydroquinate synthase
MNESIAGGLERLRGAARYSRAAALVSVLGQRSIVLVGLMGSGKTLTGRRLAQELAIDFVDSDAEIEAAAGMPICEIFAQHGEDFFRDGERRVIGRLLSKGPRVIATGGGAFMSEETRAKIAASGISVWLKADHDVLWRRVRKRSHRPLLQNDNPEQTLRALIAQRYPVYALADVTVDSKDGPHDYAIEAVFAGLESLLGLPPAEPEPNQERAPLPPLELGEAPNRPLPESAEITVALGARSYAIVIGPGLLAKAGDYIGRLAPGASCAIVTDENVARLHLPALECALGEASIRHARVVVPAGERSKSFAAYAELCDALLAARLERGDVVVALGGGVIGDLAGFAAATVRRGMRLVQMPTTLLAEVDSSVGGKTGINSALGKNLVGAFHQPSLVIADTATLDSLPPREFRAGYAEVVKYGLIGDADFFGWLEDNWRGVFAGGTPRIHAIATSCRAKAAIVGRDEYEAGERALLNLGHTFGHALERLTRYDGERLVHGEAVAIGMACAFRFSRHGGFCGDEDVARVEAHLQVVGLPVGMAAIPGFDSTAEAVLDAMYQDKKVDHGRLTFVLARRIGDCFITKSIDPGDVRRFLQDELRRETHI